MGKNLLAWSALVISGVLLAWTPNSAGSPAASRPEHAAVEPESFLPASAVAALIVDGTGIHQPGISETAAWKSLEETGLRARMFDVIETFASIGGPDLARTGRRILDHVMVNGIALAAGVSTGSDQVTPWTVCVLRDAAKFEADINSSLTTQPNVSEQMQVADIQGRKVTALRLGNTPLSVNWWSESGHLLVAVGTNAAAAIIEVAEGNADDITQHPKYQELRQSQKFTVDTLGWLDAGRLIDQFGDIPFPEPPPGGPMSIREFLGLFGLDNLKGAFLQAGFKGAACWSHSAIEVEGEMTGVLSLLKQRALTLDELPPLPPGTSGFAAATFDAGQSYSTILDVVRRVAHRAGNRAIEDVAGFEKEFADMLGGDPRTMLDALGDLWCVYSDPSGMPIPIGFSPVAVVSLKDRDRLMNVIDRLLPLLEREIRDENLAIRRSWKDGDLHISLVLAGLPIVPTVIVTEDWLVASLVPGSAQTFALRLSGELPRWVPDEEVKAALSELPERFTSITVSDPAPGYQQLLNFAPMAIGLFETQVVPNLPGGREVHLPFGIADLPVTERVVAPMFANVSVSTLTERGLAGWSRHSVPSNPIGSVGASATVPVLVALLLPAVQQAREAARRTQSRNNLKMLALAMHNYHDAYNTFPRGTVENAALEPEERLSWLYSLLPFLEQAAVFNEMDASTGWNSEANRNFSGLTIELFLNPSQPGNGVASGGIDYVGIAGVGPDAALLPSSDRKAGIFGYNRATRMRDILDGTSNTLMFADSSERGQSWAAGGRATIRGFSQSPYLNGPDGIGSPHPGIVQFALADGSVRAISVNIDEKVLEALATKAGGEIVGEF